MLEQKGLNVTFTSIGSTVVINITTVGISLMMNDRHTPHSISIAYVNCIKEYS